MTRLEIENEIKRRLGEDTYDMWSQTDVFEAIKQGISKFAHEHDWSWLQSTSTDTILVNDTTFAVPADLDVNRIAVARFTATGTQPTKLNRVTIADGFRLLSIYNTTARPRWYYIESSSQAGSSQQAVARLVPQSNVAGSVEMVYYRRPAALTTDGQEPDIPEDYHEAIIAYATAKLWIHEQDTGISQVKSGEQMALYQEVLERALANEVKLGQDEQLAWGKMDDEFERSGGNGLFRLPDNYGVIDPFGWDI